MSRLIEVRFTAKVIGNERDGKITIPAQIRRDFDIEVGDLIEVEIVRIVKKGDRKVISHER